MVETDRIMKIHSFLAIALAILTACGSQTGSTSDTTTSHNENSPNSMSGAAGEAGKAPAAAPSPSPSPDTPSASKVVTVKFPTGATEASYTDSFSGFGYIDYVFDARANQNLTAEITKSDGNNAILTVMRNGEVVEADASMVQGWTGLLPANGRYTIRIGQMRSEARKGSTPVKFSILIRIVDE